MSCLFKGHSLVNPWYVYRSVWQTIEHFLIFLNLDNILLFALQTNVFITF